MVDRVMEKQVYLGVLSCTSTGQCPRLVMGSRNNQILKKEKSFCKKILLLLFKIPKLPRQASPFGSDCNMQTWCRHDADGKVLHKPMN